VKKKILIVEDDLSIQHIVTYILEVEGYEVTGTVHVPATELKYHNPDLILLDEWVNKIEGHMLCKEIKAVEDLKHVPVVIFSTAMDIEDIAENCEADGFVKKPFDLEILINEVKKHLPLNPLRAFA
jgi:DNA-binding response OmpR family regulator